MKWIQPKGKIVQEIGELIIMEQYLRMLSPEFQVWVKEHNPKSAAEAASLGDAFKVTWKKGQPWSARKAGKDVGRPPPSQHHQRSEMGVGKPPTRENHAS